MNFASMPILREIVLRDNLNDGTWTRTLGLQGLFNNTPNLSRVMLDVNWHRNM
jgi:hypothetical protein